MLIMMKVLGALPGTFYETDGAITLGVGCLALDVEHEQCESSKFPISLFNSFMSVINKLLGTECKSNCITAL